MSDLQRIELKVTVGCCDACKRKVKKQLQRVEGVCRTEIDGDKGRVVVHGYTDPQVLMSRLVRVGKYAELMSSGKSQNPENEKKEEKAVSTKEEKPKPRPDNHPSSCNNNEERENMNCNMRKDTGLKNDDNKEKKNEMRFSSDAQVLKKESVVSTPEVKFMPYLVPVPCYAMPQYVIPMPQTIHSQGYYQAPEMPVYMHQPQQVTTFGDYFSEENTVGCNVM